jgi:uncharacterized protein
MSKSNPRTTDPWWRHGMVWLVIAGPAAAVVAGFATLAIAILNPDPLIVPAPVADAAHAPAVQARNHAATGGVRR